MTTVDMRLLLILHVTSSAYLSFVSALSGLLIAKVGNVEFVGHFVDGGNVREWKVVSFSIWFLAISVF